MLESLLGSLVREQVLLFIHANGEGYAREISRYYDASLDSVQKQLKRLEKGSVLKCEKKGRTMVYRFNKDYPFLNELDRILDRVSCYTPSELKDSTAQRGCYPRKPRETGGARVTVKRYGEVR
ncbi:MAG: winged helix-turn-helix transcriptional regulator [Candidatus Aegiribacteria sp.]|nr:winged helix-turn-helix transcriptional regulator [Candidatus Aegiribacteria sp.]